LNKRLANIGNILKQHYLLLVWSIQVKINRHITHRFSMCNCLRIRKYRSICACIRCIGKRLSSR
jgi:hypothetical protein